MGLTTLLRAFFLLAFSSSEEFIPFKSCCPAGKILQVENGESRDFFGRRTPDSIVAKCVTNIRGSSFQLDQSQIMVKDEMNDVFHDKILKETGTLLPSCELGLRKFFVTLRNKSGESYFLNTGWKLTHISDRIK